MFASLRAMLLLGQFCSWPLDVEGAKEAWIR